MMEPPMNKIRDIHTFRTVELTLIDGDTTKTVTGFVVNSDAHAIELITVDGPTKTFRFADEDRCDNTIEAMTVLTDEDEIMEAQVDFHVGESNRVMAALADHVSSTILNVLDFAPTDETELPGHALMTILRDDVEQRLKAHWEKRRNAAA